MGGTLQQPPVSLRGPWSTALAYRKGERVQWQGSTFVATVNIPTGGNNPRVDTSTWTLDTQGGGEVAYAENLSSPIFNPLAVNVVTDVPGLSVNVPANSGSHLVEARIPLVAISPSASGVAGELVTVELLIVDEAGIMLAMDPWQLTVPTAGAKNNWRALYARRRMPNNAAQKTYKAQAWVNTNNSGHEPTSLWAGAGDKTVAAAQSAFDFAPAFIQVRSL